MANAFRRKPNRLPIEIYRQRAAYSVTIAVAGRQCAFGDAGTVGECLEALTSASEASGFEVLAYCFKPDHVHLLVESTSPGFLPDFVKRFRQATGFAYRRRHGRALWQKSYYDHVLRGEESVAVGNPVRAGLVAEAKDYPFSGSLVWEEGCVEA